LRNLFASRLPTLQGLRKSAAGRHRLVRRQDNHAAAIVTAGGEQHTLARLAPHGPRRQVGDDDDRLTDE